MDNHIVVAVVIFIVGFFVLQVLEHFDEAIGGSRFDFASTSLLHPIVEEAMFRLPLLVLFSSLTGVAWIVIVTLGILFGALHFIDRSVWKKINEGENIFTKISFASWFVFATSLGIMFGIVIVLTHNLLIVIALHSVWNSTIAPLIKRWFEKKYDQREKMHKKQA